MWLRYTGDMNPDEIKQELIATRGALGAIESELIRLGVRSSPPLMDSYFHIESAPRDKELLIAGGEYRDDDETFPDWKPYEGHALVNWVGDGWQGENRPSHDNWRWHRGFRWMLPPEAKP